MIFKNFKKCLLGLFLICLFATDVFAQGLRDFSWTTISTSGIYDLHNDKIFQNFDLNCSFFFINFGVSYKNITYINSDNLSLYMGVGMGSIMQLQLGLSIKGNSIRNRYDIFIGTLFPEFGKKNPFLGLITVSPTIEYYINNSKMGLYIGLGIGLSINNTCGFEYVRQI
ncbi:MAG: hypothetical protein RO257_06515 [Candidatus Kapabacteria bacterium]|nr:hypothetical protein [Candidatus Kapabacteria bacterium]